ncbi:MAG: carbohydrate-binding family 9-like protein [Planctomycetes bacterium]|nr:carbohydrate-binding family 9-like protein [Planctomycetota bacterium]
MSRRNLRIKKVTTAFLLIIATLSPVLAGAADPTPALNWKKKPPHPEMALGFCSEPPTIDGKLSPDEWNQANCISSLQELKRKRGLSFPPTRVYMARDKEYFYFAFRCPKRSPRWYKAKSRFRDSPVFLDGNYVEFYLSPPSGGGHTPVYQFNINAYGAVADWRVIKEIGVKHPGYNPKLDLARSETSGEWILEGRIKAEKLDEGGLKPGQTWRTNWARSWPQRAWSLRPGFFIERRNMGFLHLDDDAPAVQWLDFSGLHDGKLNVPAAIRNQSGTKQTYVLSARVTGKSAEDVLASVKETVGLAPGERKKITLKSGTTFAGKSGHVELVCRTPGGERFYHQYLRFSSRYQGEMEKMRQALKEKAPMPKKLDLNVRYGQLYEALEVKADTWFLRRAGLKPTAVTVEVRPEGNGKEPVAERKLTHFQKDMALTRIELPEDAPDGKYSVRAVAFNEAGKQIGTAEAGFKRLDLTSPEINRKRRSRPGRIFDWIGNDIGKTPQVLPPWTPIQVDRKKADVSVWGRTYKLARSGLPAEITSKGDPLLNGPVRLVAVREGRKLKLTPPKKAPTVSTNVHVSTARWEGDLNSDGWMAQLDAELEYDGLIKYTLDLDCDKPVPLDALYLDIPIASDRAKFINLKTGLMHAPEGKGTVWESRSVVDNPIMGTLTPHVWVGDYSAGLAWIGDSTKGWYEKPHESAITLVREADAVHLRVHFVRGPAEVESTSMEFALLATPTKPLPVGWRGHPHEPEWKFQWFRGRYNIGEKKNGREHVSWDDPPPAHRTEGVKKARKANMRGALHLPYTNPRFTVPHAMPWAIKNASPVARLLKPDWAALPVGNPTKPVPSYIDWSISNMAYLAELQGYAGFYVDESYGAEAADVNLINGSGWFDRNGNLRGSYHSMEVREWFKRMYAVSHRYGRVGRGYILNHVSTFGMAPHVMSFAHAACFGEGMGVHEDGHSILDATTLQNLRFFSGKAWGFYGTYFGFYHVSRGWRKKDEAQKELARHSVRQTYGTLMLHDMVPNSSWMACGWGPGPEIKRQFGIEEPDVKFLGYWYEDCPVSSSTDTVKASAFVRPGKTLLVIVNTDTESEHECSIRLDRRGLGLAGVSVQYRDPVSQEIFKQDGNALKFKIAPRDVQYLVIEPAKMGARP